MTSSTARGAGWVVPEASAGLAPIAIDAATGSLQNVDNNYCAATMREVDGSL